MTDVQRPEVSRYRRNSGFITTQRVLHPLEKEAHVAALPRLKRKRGQAELEQQWNEQEQLAEHEAGAAIGELASAIAALGVAFTKLADVDAPELKGKVEDEQRRVEKTQAEIASALAAVHERDFGTAGGLVAEAARALWLVGGRFVVTLNQALAQAAIGKAARDRLQSNVAERRRAKAEVTRIRKAEGPVAGLRAAAQVHLLEAQGYELAAEILSAQVRTTTTSTTKIGRDGSLRVMQPQELETFADVGGLDDIKDQLRSTIGAILERPDEAARYHVVHNGILFHGPPGTGKTLLSRALAGEYGLRYIRFSPASIASAYLHEAAANLQRLFELAQQNTPCVLFLDEIDAIASSRDDQPSADHREVVTQLMNSLEEYRATPGLVIIAATNSIDRLDSGLREGRFDAKILVPLPDPEARKAIFQVHIERRGQSVDWKGIDLDELARLSNGRNAAAIEAFVSLAAQKALQHGGLIGRDHLIEAIKDREGKDRVALETPVRWDDVVLADETREQVLDVLGVFTNPETARALGVKAPAGILLYGPPGTGKTTIAKAMATEISASFYEQSAANLLSKWAGESEERVAKLFDKARTNRPSIIFIDEIESLLRRRSSDSAAPWEERVVGQFLHELDGLTQSEGVLLVGATNRIDIVDPAIQGRRLIPIEVGMPDAIARLRLLQVLCRDVAVAETVQLKELARLTEGMSGADLKQLRDAAGMKALRRATRAPSGNGDGRPPEIVMDDFMSAIDGQANKSSLVRI